MQTSRSHRTETVRTVKRLTGLASIAAIAGLVLLAGCRQEEKDRPIHYEKGAQLETAPLNKEAAETLRHRASKQNFGL